jgi:hypothetical protein
MTVKELSQSLRRMADTLPTEFSDFIQLKAAADVKGQVQQRVEHRGQTAEGGQFSSYKPSYAAKRKAAGRQTGYKDFSFSRQMWKSFGVKERKQSLFGTDVTLRMGDESRGKITNQGLLEAHSEREGISIIAMSKDEISALQKRVDKWLQDFINKNLR